MPAVDIDLSRPLILNAAEVQAVLVPGAKIKKVMPYDVHVGQAFWVRETFVLENTREYDVPADALPKDGRPVEVIQSDADGTYYLIPHYKATEPEPNIVPYDREDGSDDTTRWTSPVRMPQKFSRLRLQVVRKFAGRLMLLQKV